MIRSKIVVRHILPPIPTRKFDYMAFYVDEEEYGEYGYGTTEQEAIEDLVAEYPLSWAEIRERDDNSQFGVVA